MFKPFRFPQNKTSNIKCHWRILRTVLYFRGFPEKNLKHVGLVLLTDRWCHLI